MTLVEGVLLGLLIWLLLAVLVAAGWHRLRRYGQQEQQNAEDVPDEQTARAIDPTNPPRWMTYNPRPGGDRPRPQCSCHGRTIEPGERVLWWPIKDGNGAVDLFCTQTVREAQ